MRERQNRGGHTPFPGWNIVKVRVNKEIGEDNASKVSKRSSRELKYVVFRPPQTTVGAAAVVVGCLRQRPHSSAVI